MFWIIDADEGAVALTIGLRVKCTKYQHQERQNPCDGEHSSATVRRRSSCAGQGMCHRASPEDRLSQIRNEQQKIIEIAENVTSGNLFLAGNKSFPQSVFAGCAVDIKL